MDDDALEEDEGEALGEGEGLTVALVLGYTVTETLAEGDHDGYVLPVAEGLALALAVPVSLCA